MPQTRYDADLICSKCHHPRSEHHNNTQCQARIKARMLGDRVSDATCGCDSFLFDPEIPPDFHELTEEDIDHFLQSPDPIVMTAAAVVGYVERGTFDPYLEMILAAAHNRKRALRGVKGFPRLDR